MAKPFRGVVDLDIRDSVPDWGPFEQPKAPAGSPNEDYPGARPWAFTAGALHRVVVDVGGEPYADLEREAAAMRSRE